MNMKPLAFHNNTYVASFPWLGKCIVLCEISLHYMLIFFLCKIKNNNTQKRVRDFKRKVQWIEEPAY